MSSLWWRANHTMSSQMGNLLIVGPACITLLQVLSGVKYECIMMRWTEITCYGQLPRWWREWEGNLPAVIAYQPDGFIAWQHWYQNDQRRRGSDLVVIIAYHLNGSVARQSWYQNSWRHPTGHWIYSADPITETRTSKIVPSLHTFRGKLENILGQPLRT